MVQMPTRRSDAASLAGWLCILITPPSASQGFELELELT